MAQHDAPGCLFRLHHCVPCGGIRDVHHRRDLRLDAATCDKVGDAHQVIQRGVAAADQLDLLQNASGRVE